MNVLRRNAWGAKLCFTVAAGPKHNNDKNDNKMMTFNNDDSDNHNDNNDDYIDNDDDDEDDDDDDDDDHDDDDDDDDDDETSMRQRVWWPGASNPRPTFWAPVKWLRGLIKRQIFPGYYTVKNVAAAAHDLAALLIKGDQARLNFR
eukprot:jgi/Botrbrau1/794/Bobra.0181s0047.1